MSGLSGAVLYAKDLARLASFYESVAGLTVQTMKVDFVVLGPSGGQLVIVQAPERIARSIVIATPPARRESTPMKPVFAVASIARARAAAEKHGGIVDSVEREWTFDGDTVCDGHDPEGNVFQLRQGN